MTATEGCCLVSNAMLEGQLNQDFRGLGDFGAMNGYFLGGNRMRPSPGSFGFEIGKSERARPLRRHNDRRWASSLEDCKRKSIQCNRDRNDGVWAASQAHCRKDQTSARTTIPGCCIISVDLIAELGGSWKILIVKL